MSKDKKNNIHNFLIIYLILCNMLQILLIDNKGAKYDSIWKAFVLIFTVFYCIYNAIKYNLKMNKINVYLWIVLILLTSVVYLLNGTLLNRFSLRNVTSFLYPIICFLLFCVILGNTEMNDKSFEKFLNLFIAFIVYMCIFNIIYNFQLILKFKNIINGYELNISSFFDNRNTFALYLTYGIISCFIMMFYLKKKKLIYTSILLLFICNLILTLSRTMIACTFIFIFLMFIMSKEIRKNRIIHILIIVFLIFLICTPQVLNFIKNNIIRKESGLTNRDSIWKYGYYRYVEGNIFFGIGLNNEIDTLKTLYNYSSFHNTYLSILIDGGIVLGITHIILLIYAFKQIYILRKYNQKAFIIFISIFIIYIISGIIETHILFESSAPSFLETAFVYLLPMYLCNYYKKRELQLEEILYEQNN